MSELLKRLGINWHLFLAQIINFLILLFLLKKFLFRPLLNLLQKRTQIIENSLKKAQEIEKNLQEAQTQKENIILEARQLAQEIIKEAREEGERQKAAIVEEARTLAKRQIEEAQKVLEQERNMMVSEVRQEINTLIKLTLEKVLKDLTSNQIDQLILESALKKISNYPNSRV